MDREVIPIGSSSLEETRHIASDSESSFSERLVVSGRATRGTSCLHRGGGAQPFVASLDGEPNPVTIILPRVRHSHSVRSPSSPLVVIGYEWVRDDVFKYHFSITFVTSVAALERQLGLASPEDSCKVVVQRIFLF